MRISNPRPGTVIVRTFINCNRNNNWKQFSCRYCVCLSSHQCFWLTCAHHVADWGQLTEGDVVGQDGLNGHLIGSAADVGLLTEVAETGHGDQHGLCVGAPQEHVETNLKLGLCLPADGDSSAHGGTFLEGGAQIQFAHRQAAGARTENLQPFSTFTQVINATKFDSKLIMLFLNVLIIWGGEMMGLGKIASCWLPCSYAETYSCKWGSPSATWALLSHWPLTGQSVCGRSRRAPVNWNEQWKKRWRSIK